MVEEVRFALAYVGVGQRQMYFQRAGGNPFAVLPVASVLGDFTDVYFGVEVGGEGFAVVAGVAVDDVKVLGLAEVVFHGVGSKYAGHTRVESAA